MLQFSRALERYPVSLVDCRLRKRRGGGDALYSEALARLARPKTASYRVPTAQRPLTAHVSAVTAAEAIARLTRVQRVAFAQAAASRAQCLEVRAG